MCKKTNPGVMEQRAVAQAIAQTTLETRADGSVHVTGYGAVFYDPSDAGTEYSLWDDVRERIMPGAFDRAIAEDDVRGLFNHDFNLLLGRTAAKTLALSVDKKGLRYDLTMPDTSAGRDVAESIRRGDLSGSSFSFIATKTTWIEEEDADGRFLEIRQVEGVRLFDVGPVTFPAYQATTTEVAQRSLQEWQQTRPRPRVLVATQDLRLADLTDAVSSGGL